MLGDLEDPEQDLFWEKKNNQKPFRNNLSCMCFNKLLGRSVYWDWQGTLEEGVVTMLKVARELLATQQARDGEGRQLEYDDQQNGSGDAV
jgi:hypothetical protein